MTVFVVLLVILAVLLLGALVATRVAIGRSNRVVPGVRSPAPSAWLVSSRREAVYHRRLRSLGRRLELVPATEGLADIMHGIRHELIELDAYLQTVARRPPHTRRDDRRAVSARIKEIDALVRRVEERSRSTTVSLDELRERLDHLEAADEELRGLGPA